uniref:Uncharacterized protein n=1 Tax=Glossina pallidipes TaxID=7398 RepID=A0A1A9ZVD8_GLOPL
MESSCKNVLHNEYECFRKAFFNQNKYRLNVGGGVTFKPEPYLVMVEENYRYLDFVLFLYLYMFGGRPPPGLMPGLCQMHLTEKRLLILHSTLNYIYRNRSEKRDNNSSVMFEIKLTLRNIAAAAAEVKKLHGLAALNEDKAGGQQHDPIPDNPKYYAKYYTLLANSFPLFRVLIIENKLDSGLADDNNGKREQLKKKFTNPFSLSRQKTQKRDNFGSPAGLSDFGLIIVMLLLLLTNFSLGLRFDRKPTIQNSLPGKALPSQAYETINSMSLCSGKVFSHQGEEGKEEAFALIRLSAPILSFLFKAS